MSINLANSLTVLIGLLMGMTGCTLPASTTVRQKVTVKNIEVRPDTEIGIEVESKW